MAETINISQIAEIISDDIFQEFGWTKVGPSNTNWPCENHESHSKITHPSDVVFWYNEPYKEKRTYVQTDLKSYSHSSISKSIIEKSLISLSMQVSCAEKSEDWRKFYAADDATYDISGMLFVYNHDGGFDRTFIDLLQKIDIASLDLPKGSKIAILGPENIHWLYNVSQEIIRMRGIRGRNRLPDREYCSFFYPQPVRKFFLRSGEVAAASIEVLTGPRIILYFKKSMEQQGTGYVVFHRGEGETLDEFLYLLDYIRQHEMLSNENLIQIKAFDPSGIAQVNFQKAKQKYVERTEGASGSDGIRRLIEEISFSSIKRIIPHFSEIAIGMEYDR